MTTKKISEREMKELENNLELQFDDSEQPEDQLEVVSADDEVKQPEIEVKAAENTPPVEEITPDEGIEQLKQELKQQKMRAMEIERQNRELQERAYKAEVDKSDAELHLLKSGIETANRRSEILQTQLARAIAEGDHETQAKLQVAIADNIEDVRVLKNGINEYERRPKPSMEEYKPRHTDPIEKFASQLSPKSADWVRKHPEFVTDPKLYQKMVAAHQMTVSDGIVVDTPAYFREIENYLQISPRQMAQQEVNDYEDTPPPRPAPQRRQAPPAAPVTRNGTGTGSRPTIVRLTAAEREMAELSGLTEREYALQKLALQREGLMK
jgi:multidrug efflux pump subunit AcrA (membrane-fusion protein)